MSRWRIESKAKDQRPQAVVMAETDIVVEKLRGVCSGHSTSALLAALAEMYGRVVSDCIHSPDEMEKAVDFMQKHVRQWWIADRGGPFTPQ